MFTLLIKGLSLTFHHIPPVSPIYFVLPQHQSDIPDTTLIIQQKHRLCVSFFSYYHIVNTHKYCH